jgi:hypothetical protein
LYSVKKKRAFSPLNILVDIAQYGVDVIVDGVFRIPQGGSAQ